MLFPYGTRGRRSVFRLWEGSKPASHRSDYWVVGDLRGEVKSGPRQYSSSSRPRLRRGIHPRRNGRLFSSIRCHTYDWMTQRDDSKRVLRERIGANKRISHGIHNMLGQKGQGKKRLGCQISSRYSFLTPSRPTTAVPLGSALKRAITVVDW